MCAQQLECRSPLIFLHLQETLSNSNELINVDSFKHTFSKGNLEIVFRKFDYQNYVELNYLEHFF